MIIRMFEYDSQIALDNGNITGNTLTVTFPHSAVLYLRQSEKAENRMHVEIKTPGGTVTYPIRVMKIQYTIKELFEKNLLFLIPFYIFSYEKRFRRMEQDTDELENLIQTYCEIRNRLEAICIQGNITEYTKCTILDMSKKVLESIAVRYDKVREGVKKIMGGKVLEYEAKTILNQGKREGEREGRLKGEREGRLKSYVELVQDGLLPIEEAARRLNMKTEELQTYL